MIVYEQQNEKKKGNYQSMKSEKNVEIRQAMKAAGLTYKTLASILNVSIATTYRMIGADLMEEDEKTILKIIDAYARGRSLCRNQNEN